MEIELDNSIASCAAVVDKFASDLVDDEAVCLETRSLHLAALTAIRICDGVWTAKRSKAVEDILKKARAAHERFRRERGTASKYEARLCERYASLEKYFLHGQTAVSAAKHLATA